MRREARYCVDRSPDLEPSCQSSALNFNQLKCPTCFRGLRHKLAGGGQNEALAQNVACQYFTANPKFGMVNITTISIKPLQERGRNGGVAFHTKESEAGMITLPVLKSEPARRRVVRLHLRRGNDIARCFKTQESR